MLQPLREEDQKMSLILKDTGALIRSCSAVSLIIHVTAKILHGNLHTIENCAL